MIEAPIFSFLLWVSSAMTVYAYWGIAPVILSTLGFGVGTVLTAVVLILISGAWKELIGLAIMIFVTVGSAIAAIALSRSYKPAHPPLRRRPPRVGRGAPR